MAIHVVNTRTHTKTKHDFYIGRGSGLGNPFTHLNSKYSGVIHVKSRDEACKKYEKALASHMANPDSPVRKKIIELADYYIRNDKLYLVCFCKPHACHGDAIKKAIYNYVVGRDVNK